MQKQTNYKKIHIQDLENRPQKETAIPSQKLLVSNMNGRSSLNSMPCLYYEDSGLG